MKKFGLLTLLAIAIFFVSSNAFAFDDTTTHPKITEVAVNQSILSTNGFSYLVNNLGFKNGLNELIAIDPMDSSKQIKIQQVITNGARQEDSGTLPPTYLCKRGTNHFYDPVYKNGLEQTCSWGDLIYNFPVLTEILDLGTYLLSDALFFHGHANPDWGIGSHDPGFSPDDPSDADQASTDTNYYSWNQARQSFKAALMKTALNPDDVKARNKLFVRMFRSVGQVAHLLQDMAVPAHVRNDMQGHLYWSQILKTQYPGLLKDGYKNGNTKINIVNWIGNNFEAWVIKNNTNSIQGGGYAQNIFSSMTQLRSLWDTGNYSTGGQDINLVGKEKVQSGAVGLAEITAANFLSRDAMFGANNYKHPSKSKNGDCTLIKGTADDGKKTYYYQMKNGLQVQHVAAKSILVPLGFTDIKGGDFLDDTCFVEHAKNLLPLAVDYSTALIDYFFRGTLKLTDTAIIEISSSGITKIKAKISNTTENGDDAPKGKLRAFVRYKTDMKATDFSYAISQELSDKALVRNNTTEDITFDFSNNPIPAAAELFLHVVYYGDLGEEKETGIAIGMQEVSKFVLIIAGKWATLYNPLTQKVVEGLKNPLFIPNSNPPKPEFFVFPESTENGSPFADYIQHHLPIGSYNDRRSLFTPYFSSDPNGTKYDNNGNAYPSDEDNPTFENWPLQRYEPGFEYCGVHSLEGLAIVDGTPKEGSVVRDIDLYTENIAVKVYPPPTKKEFKLNDIFEFRQLIQCDRDINDKKYFAWAPSATEESITEDKDSGSVTDTLGTRAWYPCEEMLAELPPGSFFSCNLELCGRWQDCKNLKSGTTMGELTIKEKHSTTKHRKITNKLESPLGGQLIPDEVILFDSIEDTESNFYGKCNYGYFSCGGCTGIGTCGCFDYDPWVKASSATLNTNFFYPHDHDTGGKGDGSILLTLLVSFAKGGFNVMI